MMRRSLCVVVVIFWAVRMGLAEEVRQSAPVRETDTLWLRARVLCHEGDRLSGSEARSRYDRAYSLAKEAILVSPQSSGAHYFLGLSSAKLARLAGPFSSLKYIHITEREMKKVIELDPGFSDAGAYRILGKIYLDMPGALGGSNKRARRYLEKAVALAPQEVLNHLYLAQVLKALGDKAKARSEALRVIATPIDEGDFSQGNDPRKEAEGILKSR